SSANPPGHDGAPRVGEFAWHELRSNNWKESWQFYSRLFHWEKIREHDMGPNGIYFVFGQNGRALGGMYTDPTFSQQGDWTSYVEVPSVRQATEKVRELGGQVVRGPHEVPGGSWIALCSDPQGATFAMTSQ